MQLEINYLEGGEKVRVKTEAGHLVNVRKNEATYGRPVVEFVYTGSELELEGLTPKLLREIADVMETHENETTYHETVKISSRAF